MDCVFDVRQISDTMYRHTCQRCGKMQTVPAKVLRANCSAARSTSSNQANAATTSSGSRTQVKGPGDFLHDFLQKWFGEVPKAGCKCNDRIARMNRWGPSVCRERLETIVEWLIEEANKRGWQVATKIPILPKVFLRRLVLAAIKKSERVMKVIQKEK